MKAVLILFLLMCSINPKTVNAEVWNATQTWDERWEAEYAAWINEKLTTNIFKTSGNLLYGIRTDCADALYAIRIQFAYENSLPFAINAPDVLKDQMKVFGNDTNMFDQITNERERVRAFINFVSDEAGVTNLLRDTFPVQIKKINSGTLYLTEWQFLGMGKMNQHSYIIKGLSADKELVYYYSDAPRKLRTMEVNVGYPRFSYGYAPYGFRKWKQPQHLQMAEKDIAPADGYSDEQYKLLNRVGKKNILHEITRILQN